MTAFFDREEAARCFIGRILAKRASAPARIGVTYHVIVGFGCDPIPTSAHDADENP